MKSDLLTSEKCEYVFPEGEPAPTFRILENLREGKRIFHEEHGLEPNRIIVGELVWQVICEHPAWMDELRYIAPGGTFDHRAFPQQLLGMHVLIEPGSRAIRIRWEGRA